MFLSNKYTKAYNIIVARAKQALREKSSETYYEQHHIIPKSLGGKNEDHNLVLLTAREHYVCHLLLTKMQTTFRNQVKMVQAFGYLSQTNTKSGKGYSSRLYEYHKRINTSVLSQAYIGRGNPFFGRKHTQKTKEDFSKNNPAKRPDVRQKMSKPKVRVAPYPKCSIEKANKISATLQGRKIPREVVEKSRATKRNLRWIHSDTTSKMVPTETLNAFLSEGWKIGRAS